MICKSRRSPHQSPSSPPLAGVKPTRFWAAVLTGAFGIALALPPDLRSEGMREWTDEDGRQVEAEFAGLDANRVTLRLADGREIPFPLERLSPEDQEYVEARAAAVDAADPGESAAVDSGQPAAARQGDGRIVRGNGPRALTEWPDTIALDETPGVEIVKEDAEAGEFVYRTEHYEFQSNVRLGLAVVRDFGRVFEAAYLANCLLPLRLDPAPEEPGQERFVARIFQIMEEYHAAGGPVGSGGVYIPSERVFLAPAATLGLVDRGRRMTIDYSNRDAGTLIHEATHQLMNQWLRFLPIWYIEATAVYLERTPYRNGRFEFGNRRNLLRSIAMDERDVQMRRLAELMTMPHQRWMADMPSPMGRINYTSVGLLGFYFNHVDGDGDAAHLIRYLEAIDGGQSWQDAQTEHLLRGRDYAEIEAEIEESFRRLGVRVEFVGAGGSSGPAPG